MNPDSALIKYVVAGFERSFGVAPAYLAYAPARVNLIGDHTDYSDGFVLPCAIPMGTVIAIGPGDGNQIEVAALDMGEGGTDLFDARLPIPQAQAGSWANHPRGVIAG